MFILAVQVSAGRNFVEIDIPIALEWTGDIKPLEEGGLTIDLPQGQSIIQNWDENSTIDTSSEFDQVYEYSYLYSYEEEEICPAIGSYQNITDRLVDLLVICSEAMEDLNRSAEWNQKIIEANDQRSEFEANWKIEEGRREGLELLHASCLNSSQDDKRKLDLCESAKDSCENDLARANQKTTTCGTCEEDLDECKSSGNGSFFMGLIVGAVGLHLWNKRKGAAGGPSEQEEMGYSHDAPDARYSEDGPSH